MSVDFETDIRGLADAAGAYVLLVGGLPGAGKTMLISRIMRELKVRRRTVVVDLKGLRNAALNCDPAVAADLATRIGRAVPGTTYLEGGLSRVFATETAFLTYYGWYAALIEQALPARLKQIGSDGTIGKGTIWIIEASAPLYLRWNFAHLCVAVEPPAWKVDLRLSRREGITLASARRIRHLYQYLESRLEVSRARIHIRLNDTSATYANIVVEALDSSNGG